MSRYRLDELADPLDKFVEFFREHLTKELGREPTEKELVDKLPVFLCIGKN